MTACELLNEATRRKIRLRPDGATRLIATCNGPLPDDIKSQLIEKKEALIALLMSKRHLAVQVLAGEFCPLDDRLFGLVCSELIIQYHDPLCRRAFEHLRTVQQSKDERR